MWYNVRTFPERVAWWMWSGSEFLDYDAYKSNISSIWDEIWDKIDLDDEEDKNDLELDDIELDESNVDVEKDDKDIMETDVKENEEDMASQNRDKRAIKAFPRSVKFVEFSQMTEKNISKVDWNLEWYSKSDLLLVINKYIEENLDDNTDILVTVEYEDDGDKPQRVILETRPKTTWNRQSIYFSSRLLGNWENEEVSENSVDVVVEKSKEQKGSNTIQRSTSSKLTQKEQKEAEEIFSVLF